MNTNRSPLTAALPAGYAASVAVWVVWFITHVPWVGLSPTAATISILAAWFLTTVIALAGAPNPLASGPISGLITSLIGLLILGSKITESGSTFKPSAALIVAGFFATGILIGALAGAAARLLAPPSNTFNPVGRFAFATVAAAAPLLFIGGLVTSTGSGMAVPDWPTTYGANMFLYPLGNARCDVFLEHSHRLFGVLLGIGGLLLTILTLLFEDRAWVKRWACIIFACIVAQGLIGGVRIRFGSVDTAMVHGIIAQAIFSALVALANFTSTTYRNALPQPDLERARRLRAISTAALHSTLLQLLFGAMYRHLRSPHALWSHIGFSLVVVVLTILAGLLASSLAAPRAPETVRLTTRLTRAGRTQVALVTIQFLLGWLAFSYGSKRIDTTSVTEALVRTAHQANGAMLLAFSTTVCVLARRLCPARSFRP